MGDQQIFVFTEEQRQILVRDFVDNPEEIRRQLCLHVIPRFELSLARIRTELETIGEEIDLEERAELQLQATVANGNAHANQAQGKAGGAADRHYGSASSAGFGGSAGSRRNFYGRMAADLQEQCELLDITLQRIEATYLPETQSELKLFRKFSYTVVDLHDEARALADECIDPELEDGTGQSGGSAGGSVGVLASLASHLQRVFSCTEPRKVKKKAARGGGAARGRGSVGGYLL